MKNKIFLSILCLLLSILACLTIYARKIHENSLLHVKTIDIQKQDFTCCFEDEFGNELITKRRAIGIPKSCFTDVVYIVDDISVYGEPRKSARKTEVIIIEDYISDDYYAVSTGVSAGDKIIIYDERLYDRMEVILE